jgi:DNA ligase 1
MRFHKATDAVQEKIKYPVLALPKVDGVRGGFLTNKFTARTGKGFKNKNVGQFYSHPALKGFDGELFRGNLTDEDLCRKTTSLVNSFSWNTSGELPKLMVFDWVTEETKILPYLHRYNLLKNYLSDIPKEFRQYIVPPELEIKCYTLDEVLTAHEYFISLGYEGTVLRLLDAPHKEGRSTVNEGYFLRMKDFSDSEGECIGFTEAMQNNNEAVLDPMGYTERSSHKANKTGLGMIGCLQLLIDEEVVNISCGCMTHEERIDYFENPEKILGKILKFKEMVYGKKDKPRLAQFTGFRADEDM